MVALKFPRLFVHFLIGWPRISLSSGEARIHTTVIDALNAKRHDDHTAVFFCSLFKCRHGSAANLSANPSGCGIAQIRIAQSLATLITAPSLLALSKTTSSPSSHCLDLVIRLKATQLSEFGPDGQILARATRHIRLPWSESRPTSLSVLVMVLRTVSTLATL